MQSLEEFEESTLKQLRMTPVTWSKLIQNGVTESTPLVIDLFFFADDEANAKTLVESLRAEIDLEIRYLEQDKIYAIEGKAKSRIYNLSVLLELVRRMCDLAFQHQCTFDGWGAEVPHNEQKKSRWKFWK